MYFCGWVFEASPEACRWSTYRKWHKICPCFSSTPFWTSLAQFRFLKIYFCFLLVTSLCMKNVQWSWCCAYLESYVWLWYWKTKNKKQKLFLPFVYILFCRFKKSWTVYWTAIIKQKWELKSHLDGFWYILLYNL